MADEELTPTEDAPDQSESESANIDEENLEAVENEEDIETEVEEPEEKKPKKEKCPECPAMAPAWMATFADMATLLMAFFVLILSFVEMETPSILSLIHI
mgnify:CR=1 FL=1